MKKALLVSALLISTPALADSAFIYDVTLDPSLGMITGNTWSYTGAITPFAFNPSCYPSCGTADELRFGVYFTTPLILPGSTSATLTIIPVTQLPAADGWYGSSTLTVNGTMNVVPWGIPTLTTSTTFTPIDTINYMTGNYVYYANPEVNLPLWIGGYTVTVDPPGLSVPSVPEPGTWALMLAGFAGIFMAFRRKHERPFGYRR